MLPLSLQTNVTSLFAQQQLEQNDNFESNTIQQLTSGYRINSAGDDAAGLAVANELQANVTELQQGVINAANGTSTLQIMDGGLSNISNLLDRLQTLATESASGTFEGSRTTLNNEFQSVLSEITRQAGNIGLASGGTTSNTGTIGSSQYNTAALNIFIGGGDTGNANDAQVTFFRCKLGYRCHCGIGVRPNRNQRSWFGSGRGWRRRKPAQLRHLARQFPNHELDGFRIVHQGRQHRGRSIEPGEGADPAAIFHRRFGTGQLHAGSDLETPAVGGVRNVLAKLGRW